MSRNGWRSIGVSAVVLAAATVGASAVSGSFAQSAQPAATVVAPSLHGYDAHTEPSAKSKVNFSAPGVVAEVMVKEGDPVKKGQTLIKLDDRADLQLLKSLKLEGDSDAKVKASEADLKQKRVELEKAQKNLEGGGGNELEVENAKVAVVIREYQVEVEKMTREQKQLEAARQAVKVEQMTLTAPFDGIVDKIDLKIGETPETQRFAVQVVSNAPVWVNVYLPSSVALNLKLGDSLDVKYKDLNKTVAGKVIKLSPVADAASETREVRLELANPEGLPSGLGVTVMAQEAGGGDKSTAAR